MRSVSGGKIQKEIDRTLRTAYSGKCVVSRSLYEKYGKKMVLELNGTPYADIVVIEDEALSKMSLKERMDLLR